MQQVSILFKRELLAYFRSPLGYIFTLSFLLTGSACAFFLGGLYESDQAQLRPFFDFLPWLYLLLIPAVAMRLWAEEYEARTIELVFTLPLRLSEVVLAKFLAGWIFVLFALALTFPLVLTIAYLGEPDWGVLASNYLAAGLLGASFLSVSCIASALTKNQVTAFVLGVLACFVLILLGWGVFTEILSQALPPEVVDGLATFGVMPHFETLMKGVVDSRDLAYFLTLIALSLGLTGAVLYTRKADKRSQPLAGVSVTRSLIPLAAFVLLIISATGPWYHRFDLTEEKVYSLSQGSLKIIKGLQREVEVKLYLSKALPNLAPVWQAHGRRVEELLREYEVQSQGSIKLQVIEARPDSDDELWAQKFGLKGFPTPQGETAYLGAVFLSGDKEVAVPVFDPRKEEALEFEVSEALVKLQREQTTKIGIYSALPIGFNGSQPQDAAGNRLDWIFLQRLKDFYQVEVFQNPPAEIPADINVFIALQAAGFDEKFEFALDQFILRGGRLLLILDAFSRYAHVNKNSLPISAQPLSRLFAHWGLRFSAEQVVGDLKRSTKVEEDGNWIDDPFYLTLGTADFAPDHVIMANLKQLRLVETGSFDLSGLAKSLSYEPLIRSSESAGLAPLPDQGDRPSQIQKIASEKQPRQLAGLLRGRFSSAFSQAPEALEAPKAIITESTAEGFVLVMADSDFLHESQAIESLQIGEQTVLKPRNDNINFLTNSLAFLAGSSELIAIRSSGRNLRPFTRLKELQQAALDRWQATEQKLNQELSQLAQRKLDFAKDPATMGEPGDLKSFRERERALRVERREIRRILRADTERLGHQLTAANLLVVPALVGFVGILVYRRRHHFRTSKED